MRDDAFMPLKMGKKEYYKTGARRGAICLFKSWKFNKEYYWVLERAVDVFLKFGNKKYYKTRARGVRDIFIILRTILKHIV